MADDICIYWGDNCDSNHDCHDCTHQNCWNSCLVCRHNNNNECQRDIKELEEE